MAVFLISCHSNMPDPDRFSSNEFNPLNINDLPNYLMTDCETSQKEEQQEFYLQITVLPYERVNSGLERGRLQFGSEVKALSYNGYYLMRVGPVSDFGRAMKLYNKALGFDYPGAWIVKP
ncbi:MAG: hypothetical protein JXA60_09330 [Candidatus Coatesbacteria bacterium]|nr:hypothetical protein [Candidatus Coatesbacteria bacterium]